MLAVIGGSGLVGLGQMKVIRREIARTPFGGPSGPLVIGEMSGATVLFLARHGPGHIHAPHRINYRANVWALRQAGATSLLAVAAVGGIADNSGPGVIAAPDQIIDYTYGREHTFCDGSDRTVVHVDFTQPYSDALREAVLKAAASAGEPLVATGVYGATQGPRLETHGARRRNIGRHDWHARGSTGTRALTALCTFMRSVKLGSGLRRQRQRDLARRH